MIIILLSVVADGAVVRAKKLENLFKDQIIVLTTIMPRPGHLLAIMLNFTVAVITDAQMIATIRITSVIIANTDDNSLKFIFLLIIGRNKVD